jgi:hypothetical protein
MHAAQECSAAVEWSGPVSTPSDTTGGGRKTGPDCGYGCEGTFTRPERMENERP